MPTIFGIFVMITAATWPHVNVWPHTYITKHFFNIARSHTHKTRTVRVIVVLKRIFSFLFPSQVVLCHNSFGSIVPEKLQSPSAILS